MPRVTDLGECPLCFGRLLPLSVCRSCNSVAVRDGLEEIDAQIACEDCGAANPTHFVCSACNARFPFDEVAQPRGPACPVCKSPVPPGAQLCPKCSAVLPNASGGRPRRHVRGEYREADVHEVSRIPGVGRQRAEALCAAGYNALWKIARASEEELSRVRGIGKAAAVRIKESIGLLLLVGRPRTKEEILSEEYECPLCGTLTSLFSTRCHDCGAAFDDEEIDDEFRREVAREEEKGLLAFYDVRLLEDPDNLALQHARALLLLSMGRPAEALASLDKILEADPTNPRALQAKVRALAGAKGVGSAAQVLRGLVPAGQAPPPGSHPGRATGEEEEALRALGGLEEISCPECGERQLPGATECPACGHRFARDVPAPPRKAGAPPPGQEPAPPSPVPEPDRLLEELERAVAGEAKMPPPPLRPLVPETVVDRKREMHAVLLRVPGVSRRAAEAVAAFFQDLDQVRLADVDDLEGLPGVAPAEARLILEAVGRHFAREEAPPPAKREPTPSPPTAAPEARPMVRSPRTVPSPPRVAAEMPMVRRPLEIAAARRGLVNGKGLVNGRGRVNGLINGTGFVNGGSLAEQRLPRQNLMPRYIAVAASLLMLFSIVAALSAPGFGPAPFIEVDGNPADWNGMPLFKDVGTAPTNSALTIMEVAVSHDPVGLTLYARVQVADPSAFGSATDYRSLYVFLDADGNPSTGYEVGVIGADYAARVSGGGTIDSTILLRFEGPDPRDWNGWRASGAVTAKFAGPNTELAVSTDGLEGFVPSAFRVVFAFDDNAGSTSHTELPIGPERSALRVRQEEAPDTVGIGPGQQFLPISLRNLGSGVVNVQDIVVATSLPHSLSRTPPFAVDSGGTIVMVSVDTTGLADGASVSASVSSVQADAPYAIVGPEARAYVGQVQLPAPKRIDGLFEDWRSPQADGVDTPSVQRPSLDIQSRDGAVVGNDVFLYARLAGPALEGAILPQRLSRPQPPGGGGGGGSPGPPPPPLIGQDYIRFYLDTNESEPGGFDAYGLLVDRYIEVRGRGGRIADASLYVWNGTDWPREGNVTPAVGMQEVELRAAIPAATFNMTRLVAVTADWSGLADRTSAVGTRGTRGLSEEGPVLLDVAGNERYWFRDTSHGSETACTGSNDKVASTTPGSGPMQTIVLNMGEDACWYVDETTGTTIPAGDWETLIDVSSGGSGAAYDVRLEIWDKTNDVVSEEIGNCLNVQNFGDDRQCLVEGVPSKTIGADKVVRLYIKNSGSGPTVSIDYDDGDTTGDSRATLPIPEFADIAFPLTTVLLSAFLVRRIRRRREAA